MTNRRAAALTWIATTIAIVLLNIFLPQPFGLSAMPAVFEPYLVLVALTLAVALFRSVRGGQLLLISLIILALARYGPSWMSAPAPLGASSSFKVSTWNMHAGAFAVERVLQGVATTDAEVLAIEELGPEAVAALAEQSERFPYTALASNSRFLDVGLLSQHPLTDIERSTSPPFVRAVVHPPTNEPVVIYAVHAPLARLVDIGGVPVGVDFSVRDRAASVIRSRIQEDLEQDLSVIVMGDFNTTERERAYGAISAGLRDAHLDAGVGPGLSWRPPPVDFLPFGMLRIDYVFSTPDLQATSSTVDCSLPSDHCRVDVELTPSRSATTD